MSDIRHDELRELLATYAGRGNVPGIALAVRAPRLGLRFTGAAGIANRATGRPLTPDATFRYASNTKTYVAAALLRLAEQGRLALDAPLTRWLPEEDLALLRGGGYAPAAITPRQLANHTSGLADHARVPSYLEFVAAHSAHRWTRREQLRFAMREGRPAGPPGAQVAYSDTGYILLGQVIETVSERPLATALRELLDFAGLGLASTYLESAEAPPPGAGPIAHTYRAEVDFTHHDPSFDLYGGGGLVGSIDDLAAFYAALFDGRVFASPATLTEMLTITPGAAEREAALGLFGQRWNTLPSWYHTGYWGSFAMVCPAAGVTLALMYFQAQISPASDTGPFTTALRRRFRRDLVAHGMLPG